MEWRNAGFRTKIGKVDGSVIFPILLTLLAFHIITIGMLIFYAGTSFYMTLRGRSMQWLVCRFRFWIRNGVVLARTPRYWRYVRNGIY